MTELIECEGCDELIAEQDLCDHRGSQLCPDCFQLALEADAELDESDD